MSAVQGKRVAIDLYAVIASETLQRAKQPMTDLDVVLEAAEATRKMIRAEDEAWLRVFGPDHPSVIANKRDGDAFTMFLGHLNALRDARGFK